MTKQEYDLTFKFTITIEATPKTIAKLHDTHMRRFIKAVSKEFGPPSCLRDCKTGRFRKIGRVLG
jgi:hypothetical protein